MNRALYKMGGLNAHEIVMIHKIVMNKKNS